MAACCRWLALVCAVARVAGDVAAARATGVRGHVSAVGASGLHAGALCPVAVAALCAGGAVQRGSSAVGHWPGHRCHACRRAAVQIGGGLMCCPGAGRAAGGRAGACSARDRLWPNACAAGAGALWTAACGARHRHRAGQRASPPAASRPWPGHDVGAKPAVGGSAAGVAGVAGGRANVCHHQYRHGCHCLYRRRQDAGLPDHRRLERLQHRLCAARRRFGGAAGCGGRPGV